MITQQVAMNMPLAPAGYEYTGDYRQAKLSEPYIKISGGVVEFGPSFGPWPILRKVRPATVQVEIPWETVEYFGTPGWTAVEFKKLGEECRRVKAQYG